MAPTFPTYTDWQVTITDSLTLTDSLSYTWTAAFTISDIMSLTDSTAFLLGGTISDIMSLTDSLSLQYTARLIISDKLSLIDGTSWSGSVFAFTISDSLSLNDDLLAIASPTAIVSEIVSDFVSILEDIMIEDGVLKRTTTSTDSLGNISSLSVAEIPIDCMIFPAEEADINHIAPGTAITGTMTGYFRPSYSYMGTDYTIQEGDEVTRDSINYRVQTIIGKWKVDDVVIFIEARLRRL